MQATPRIPHSNPTCLSDFFSPLLESSFFFVVHFSSVSTFPMMPTHSCFKPVSEGLQKLWPRPSSEDPGELSHLGPNYPEQLVPGCKPDL